MMEDFNWYKFNVLKFLLLYNVQDINNSNIVLIIIIFNNTIPLIKNLNLIAIIPSIIITYFFELNSYRIC